MARIDAILGIVRQQGADELHVGVGKEPKMFAAGAPKKLSIPATSEETLRDLLGEILDPAREAELKAHGSVELDYDGGKQGAYHVTLTRSTAGFDALFMQIEALKAAQLMAAKTAPPSAAKTA
ncbi:MAG TPA: hypothetical protein VGI70_05455, partial [Polyangiales bacterium]